MDITSDMSSASKIGADDGQRTIGKRKGASDADNPTNKAIHRWRRNAEAYQIPDDVRGIPNFPMGCRCGRICLRNGQGLLFIGTSPVASSDRLGRTLGR